MKAILVVTMFLFGSAFWAPPADWVVPARSEYQPQQRIAKGFVYLPEIGGMMQIRFGQWFTEMAAVLVLGGLGAVITRCGTKEQRPAE